MTQDKSAVFLLPIVSPIMYIYTVDVNSFLSTALSDAEKNALLMNHFIYSDLSSCQFQNLDSVMS